MAEDIPVALAPDHMGTTLQGIPSGGRGSNRGPRRLAALLPLPSAPPPPPTADWRWQAVHGPAHFASELEGDAAGRESVALGDSSARVPSEIQSNVWHARSYGSPEIAQALVQNRGISHLLPLPNRREQNPRQGEGASLPVALSPETHAALSGNGSSEGHLHDVASVSGGWSGRRSVAGSERCPPLDGKADLTPRQGQNENHNLVHENAAAPAAAGEVQQDGLGTCSGVCPRVAVPGTDIVRLSVSSTHPKHSAGEAAANARECSEDQGLEDVERLAPIAQAIDLNGHVTFGSREMLSPSAPPLACMTPAGSNVGGAARGLRPMPTSDEEMTTGGLSPPGWVSIDS